MNKKGSFKVFLIVASIIIVLIGVFYFLNKGEIPCPRTPDDQTILRLPLSGILAGGKQTGAETHKFANGERISVCCANVESTYYNRAFKDCLHYNKEGKQDYQVVWEKKDNSLILIKEIAPWQGKQCIYNFDNAGQMSGRLCEDPEETKKVTNPTSESDCESVSDSIKDLCYYNWFVKQKNAKSLEDCDKITTEEQITENQRTLKESCYLDVAELKGDKSICEMIKTDYRKELCYTNVVRVTGDTSICEAHEDYTRKRDDCYEDIAIAKNDESFCAEINQDYAKRDDCYIIIAYKKGDTSICNTIENRDWLRYHSYYDELCQ